MSNRSGGTLLNKVLKLLLKRNVFALIGNKESQKITRKILKIAEEEDCNGYEILDNVGRKLSICERCLKSVRDINTLKKGICPKCVEEEKRYG